MSQRQSQAVAWQAEIEKFSTLGYNVAMVSYDDAGVLTRFARSRKIGFTLLADKGSALIKAFDVLDHSAPEGSAWYGLARPIIYVVDPKGKITHRFSGSNYTVRPSPDEVLQALR